MALRRVDAALNIILPAITEHVAGSCRRDSLNGGGFQGNAAAGVGAIAGRQARDGWGIGGTGSAAIGYVRRDSYCCRRVAIIDRAENH